MLIDTSFDFNSDSNGGDPDRNSPTLRAYHMILWDKILPNGQRFGLSDEKEGAYLYHHSQLGEYYLGSDAITHSYRNHASKKWLTDQIPGEVQELYDSGSTIGAFILFPNNQIEGKHTLNQARGVNRLIDDRFDLTLECIRRHYLRQSSPLDEALDRYRQFFSLFHDFNGYVTYFLLDDLVDKNGRVRFYLPFDDFKTKPGFSGVPHYLEYKSRVMEFIKLRNARIRQLSV